MRFIADLHIHSHFSRATSRNLDPEHLVLWAKKKGITVLGTGDFTHPGWVAELQEKLVDAENGLFRLRPELEKTIEREVPESCRGQIRFLLSGEISCIYKRGGKTRKVHHLILMPDFESVSKLNRDLDRIGNIKSDGRPILGLDSKDLLEMVLYANERSFFIPAHVWTPWFSIFGSKSGFDAIEECFGDLTPHIHALETGLSSDPPMNRLLSSLDDYILVSNSDAHSPQKLGREANIFDSDLDYYQMLDAMISKEGFDGTIEFYPEEGKYHLDGHRKCQVRLHPRETMKHEGICPSCGKTLTVGVLHRVAELSDREEPRISKAFHSLIPLPEILSDILGCGPATKKVTSFYEEMIAMLGPELGILMDVPLKKIQDAGGVILSTGIDRMRRGQVIRQEGYDGEYGRIRLFQEAERAELAGQKSLFEIKRKSDPEKEIFSIKGTGRGSPESPAESEGKAGEDPILGLLNPDQKEAVLYGGGHLLIIAGPGTGKTMTLSHRIAHMVRSKVAGPEQILSLTFTNKAAGEMKRRVAVLLGGDKYGRIWTTTFHGFCLEILRNDGKIIDLPPGFTICSEQDSAILAEQVVCESGKGKRFASRLVKELPHMKAAFLANVFDQERHIELLPYFEKYQKKLRGLGMLDLGDLETETLKLFKENPEVCLKYSGRYQKIFVDEYQDTNYLQANLLKGLVTAGTSEICAIGDPDQAIYGFRGADVSNFQRFSEDFPGAREISLRKNYRSTRVILKAASDIMSREEPLQGMAGEGEPILLGRCRTHSEEAETVVEQIEKLMGGTSYFSLDSGRVSSFEDGEDLSFSDIAVLFRMNEQGDAFEEAFSRAGIPFVRSGEKPLISRYPANIIWRFLQALKYPGESHYRDAYLHLLSEKERAGDKILKMCMLDQSVDNLIDQAVSLHDFDLSSDESVSAVRGIRRIAENSGGEIVKFLDKLSMDRGIDHSGLSGDRIALMSIHAAKGLEWQVVFITGCEDILMPCRLFGDSDEEEEKRLLYVGVTRSRRQLVISHAERRKISGRMLDANPSPFLSLISEELSRPLERSKWKRKVKRYKQLDLF